MALGGALGLVLVTRNAAVLFMTGVSQEDIHLGFTCPAWHHRTFTLVVRGSRGTYGTGWRAWAGFGCS